MVDNKDDPRLDPRIIPSRTAIVFIDLQNDIIRSTANPFYSSIAEQVKERKVVENAVRIADAAHDAGVPLFYVTVVRRRDYEDVVNQLTELVAAGKAPPPWAKRTRRFGNRVAGRGDGRCGIGRGTEADAG